MRMAAARCSEIAGRDDPADGNNCVSHGWDLNPRSVRLPCWLSNVFRITAAIMAPLCYCYWASELPMPMTTVEPMSTAIPVHTSFLVRGLAPAHSLSANPHNVENKMMEAMCSVQLEKL